MISESNGQSGFKVVPVETVKVDLRSFHTQSMELGKGAPFLIALRQVYYRLHRDPHGFGEALYRLPALKLLVYQGVISPLVVTFGVHEELPLVLIRVVNLLADPGE
jgi:hypothetical protein